MRTLTCFAVTAVILVTPFSSSLARANVYRCELDDGQISYQQIPCHNGSEPMKLDERHSGWSQLRPGERVLLDSYREKDAMRSRKPADRKKAPATESKSCWDKRTQLEAIRSKLRRGYTLKESNQLRRKRDNYEDYLRQFCS